uniref:F-box domain-containing protein n=1 Tax=Compsopogon caeruleus TaxID=31354 RepID=A0A6T6CTN6_9RHOD|mmetsp:Transcript_8985/g.18116  ORF Transcript_8985/g.18116 Transcript_8985/m.18116 type:complete len:438 (+) Transcript_8985:119-1432(+)
MHLTELPTECLSHIMNFLGFVDRIRLQMVGNRQLHELVGDAEVQEVSFPGLESHVTDEVLRKILGGRRKRSLRALSLAGCDRLTASGVEHALRFCTRLERIDLAACPWVSEHFLMKLLSCRSMRIRILRVSYNGQLMSLPQSEWLEVLDYRACGRLNPSSLSTIPRLSRVWHPSLELEPWLAVVRDNEKLLRAALDIEPWFQQSLTCQRWSRTAEQAWDLSVRKSMKARGVFADEKIALETLRKNRGLGSTLLHLGCRIPAPKCILELCRLGLGHRAALWQDNEGLTPIDRLLMADQVVTSGVLVELLQGLLDGWSVNQVPLWLQERLVRQLGVSVFKSFPPVPLTKYSLGAMLKAGAFQQHLSTREYVDMLQSIADYLPPINRVLYDCGYNLLHLFCISCDTGAVEALLERAIQNGNVLDYHLPYLPFVYRIFCRS